METKVYVLVYQNTGSLVGIDSNSGGYPFEVRFNDFNLVHFWSDKNAALRYIEMFPDLAIREFIWGLQ